MTLAWDFWWLWKTWTNIYPIFSGFLTLHHHMGTRSLKIKISKIGLRHVLIKSKLGLELKFHDLGSFGGFGKCGQTNKQKYIWVLIFMKMSM